MAGLDGGIEPEVTNVRAMVYDLSVVVPIFNNESDVLDFFPRLIEILKATNLHFEILAVLDGPTDKSKENLSKFLSENGNLREIELTRNFGQVAAILAGINYAQGNCVVVISVDGQDPPELIPRMYDLYKAGNDVVVAHRTSRDDSIVNRVTSRVAYNLLRRKLKGIPKGGFDYFLLSRRASLELAKIRGRYRFIQSDVLNLGFPLATIGYHRNASSSKSNYSLLKRLEYFENGIIDISYQPIRFFILVGFLIASSGAIISIASIFSYFNDRDPFEGFSAIFLSLLIIGGMILICVGFVGMYIYRIYDLLRGRALFIIKNVDK